LVQLSRAWRAAAFFFSILAVIFGVVALRMKWGHAHADFDVLGVIWLMQNAGQIAILVLFLICAIAALVFWIRYLLSE
jgi:uncharacterized YccA/Bax inhibitor family protein